MAQDKKTLDEKPITEEKSFPTDYSTFSKLLPNYDGNRRTLSFYIEGVENALGLITNKDDACIACLITRAHQTTNVLPIKIKLEDIEQDNVKKAIQQAEEVKTATRDPVTLTNSPSWSSISLYMIIIAAGIGAAAYKSWWIPRSAHSSVPNQSEDDSVQLQSEPSARLHLKGRGVI